MKNPKLKSVLLSTAALITVAATFTSTGSVAGNSLLTELAPVISLVEEVASTGKNKTTTVTADTLTTKTPIKHLVVVFNENRSFDHYFGTYPNALNVEGEPRFEPAKNTPTQINNLLSSPTLLDNNPNANPNVVPSNGAIVTEPTNGANATNPFRIDRTQADTAGQNHSYTPEQSAYDNGKNDLFPFDTGNGTAGGAGAFGTKGQVMGYFDGNTVTAYWNYAQNFAMSDNAWTDDFGPSTPGAINMFSGTTNGAVIPAGLSASTIADSQGGLTLINDTDPAGDVCSSKTAQVQMTSKNIGDLLNAANIPWGSFVGGFNLQTINDNGSTGCSRSHVSEVTGRTNTDYVPHHIWFQYYASTANPTHARPTSTAAIGYTTVPGKKTVDPANHGYDLNDFTAAVGSGNFPAVSFIKMESYQDEHPGNSNSLDAQTGFVTLVNFLMQQPDWDSTAVILAYDDSDGWADHASGMTHGSFSSSDTLTAPGQCGVPGVTPVANGVKGLPVAGRCGPGTRTPFLVISPYAKQNYVSHVQITQASIPQFIEDNWLGSERIGGGSFDATTGSIMDMFDFTQKKSVKLVLDPTSGLIDETTKIKN
ncbi:phospholipase C [Bradyrhizobium sp.]|jgi:phospholipase C|uniref:phospholipase C n=1 Tax=Bradyrhizobium sp. TaxID=376 RepID=UPI003C1B2007